MKSLLMCRICLATNVRLCSIASHLRDMFERITGMTFKREDSRPVVACYICHARLQSCYRLRTSCLRSEDLLTEMMSNSELIPQDVLNTNTLRIVSVLQFSLGHALQDTTECHIKEEDSEIIHDAELDQRIGEDIKIEPQDENDAQLDDDNQCSHLDDLLDVINGEADIVETDDEDIKLGIEDTILNPWHVQRWVKGLEGQDVRPSTFGTTANDQSCLQATGSDFDSEFDDEFDIEITAQRQEIPTNEDLEEPVRNIISQVEMGMDDEADRLLGISSNFEWVEGFSSFKGVPETFTGPIPGPINNYDSAYDAFTDIWNDDIINQIVYETNRYAEQTIENLKAKGELKPSSRLHEWVATDTGEIRVLFGVYMYMAIDPRTSLDEYWKSGVLGMPEFRHLMTYNRYILLNKFLHFVDNSDASHNCQQSEETENVLSRRLHKLSPIIMHLEKKFDSLYNLSRNISIDESLTLLKGRLSWVQTIRSKAARFGIKSYELCESQTGYMARFQIYTGKSDASLDAQSLSVDLGGKSTKIVLKLLQGLERRGHCVTMDNFYNCPSLSRYLKSSGFDSLGTLRTNRRNVPSDIAKVPKNVPKGTIIARQCGDVSIVSWKDSKLVTIISTYHDDSTFVGSKAGKTVIKPVCVKDYNRTMGEIDLKDQKLSMYLLERKRGLKWYIKIFKRLLNVSIHNAFVMYVSSLKRQNKLAVTHREFRYELAQSLVEQGRSCPLVRREDVDKPTRLRRDVVHVPKYLSGRSSRKRCVVCCRQGIDKFVHSQCTTCDVYLCFENCWAEWHSSQHLKGQEKRGRKRKRVE